MAAEVLEVVLEGAFVLVLATAALSAWPFFADAVALHAFLPLRSRGPRSRRWGPLCAPLGRLCWATDAGGESSDAFPGMRALTHAPSASDALGIGRKSSRSAAGRAYGIEIGPVRETARITHAHTARTSGRRRRGNGDADARRGESVSRRSRQFGTSNVAPTSGSPALEVLAERRCFGFSTGEVTITMGTIEGLR